MSGQKFSTLCKFIKQYLKTCISDNNNSLTYQSLNFLAQELQQEKQH